MTKNDPIASSKQKSILTRRCKDYHAYPSRCTSTGRKCDGYSQLKHDFETQVIRFSLEPSARPESAPSSRYDNVHYLEFYYHCVGPMLSGLFDHDFWCGTVLQMAHAEPTVRNAMIALAHLNQQQSGSLAHARRFSASRNTESNREFVLHYNKAIRCLVARMTEASYAPETGLVTCLLFACIEFLRADTQNALLHMRNGLYIVSELRRKQSVGNSSSSLQSRTTLARNGVNGPLDLIEKTLVPVFTQGLISALLYGVDVDTEFAFLDSTPLTHGHMQAFTTLREARFAYCEIRNASILLARDMAIKLFQGLEPSAPNLERQSLVMACHESWLSALLAFEKNARDLSAANKLGIVALKIGFEATYTATACVHSARQMNFDSHLTSFRAIISFAALLINARDGTLRTNPHPAYRTAAAANFTFDTLLVTALYYTALRCRHSPTRREAMALLSRNIPREGLWDPEQYCVVAERVVHIEEEEVDERGWPVEQTRLWSASVTADAGAESGFRAEFWFARDVGRGLERGWSGWYGVNGEEMKREKGRSVGEMWVDVPLKGRMAGQSKMGVQSQ